MKGKGEEEKRGGRERKGEGGEEWKGGRERKYGRRGGEERRKRKEVWRMRGDEEE